MASAELVLYEEEFRRLDTALRKLRQESNARVIFLIDRTGQQIAGPARSTSSTPPLSPP